MPSRSLSCRLRVIRDVPRDAGDQKESSRRVTGTRTVYAFCGDATLPSILAKDRAEVRGMANESWEQGRECSGEDLATCNMYYSKGRTKDRFGVYMDGKWKRDEWERHIS